MYFRGGGVEDEDIDAHFDALMLLKDLYNEGLSLLQTDESGKLSELLDAVREELIHVNKIYGRNQCFVATTVYRHAYAPQLEVFRDIRDRVLKRSLAGRVFIHAYYNGTGKLLASWLAAMLFVIPVTRILPDFMVGRYDEIKQK